MEQITGKTLIEWGFTPGSYFNDAIKIANSYRSGGMDDNYIREVVQQLVPKVIPIQNSDDVPFFRNIEADNELEQENIIKVEERMKAVMSTPTVVEGAIMPDACPTGGMPVGGIVSTKNAIHPGFHSSDICCSMAISVFDNVSPDFLLETGMMLSHFGPGGRPYSNDMQCSNDLLAEFEGNPYLKNAVDAAQKHMGTQGDGNHFYFVGTLRSTGQTALVTHHGSRKPGALLYKLGMETAERFRKKLSPETAPGCAWIPADTKEGEDYWVALQIIRKWTKKNHFVIHDAVAKYTGARVKDRFWNEHNFVFQKSDGLFYHGKGATPAWDYFAQDATDLTIIPLNMSQPVLIVRGKNNPKALGFSPHGAGRNFSRTQHLKTIGNRPLEDIIKEETEGLVVHFKSGRPDLSELPSAYKNADAIVDQINKFELAEIVDYVDPYGTIMAGDWSHVWRKKKR